jgi:hypothetical protein
VTMKAATWPDWVRSGPRDRKKHNRATWHYVNLPFIPDDVDADTREEIESRFSDGDQNHGDILKVIPKVTDALGAKAEMGKQKEDRAIALCWLLHLVG